MHSFVTALKTDGLHNSDERTIWEATAQGEDLLQLRFCLH